MSSTKFNNNETLTNNNETIITLFRRNCFKGLINRQNVRKFNDTFRGFFVIIHHIKKIFVHFLMSSKKSNLINNNEMMIIW